MRFPVRISPRVSRRLRAALLFLHALALAALFLVTHELALLVGSFCGVLISLWRSWPHSQQLPESLVLREDGRVDYRVRGSVAELVATPVSVTSFGRSLTLLTLDFEEGAEEGGAHQPRLRRLLLLGDSLEPREWRMLHVWLRWVLPFRRDASVGKVP